MSVVVLLSTLWLLANFASAQEIQWNYKEWSLQILATDNVSVLQTNHLPSKKFLLDLVQWKRVLTNINNTSKVGEVGAYPHTEACPHTLLFAHRITSD